MNYLWLWNNCWCSIVRMGNGSKMDVVQQTRLDRRPLLSFFIRRNSPLFRMNYSRRVLHKVSFFYSIRMASVLVQMIVIHSFVLLWLSCTELCHFVSILLYIYWILSIHTSQEFVWSLVEIIFMKYLLMLEFVAKLAKC